MSRLTTVGSKAVDFSFARPPVNVLVANGFETVVRYISGSGVSGGGSGKNATRAELDTYLAAGLGVMLVWEQKVAAPLGGRAQGLKDGLRSWELLRELGCPEDVPVLVAVDFDVLAATRAGVIYDGLGGTTGGTTGTTGTMGSGNADHTGNACITTFGSTAYFPSKL